MGIRLIKKNGRYICKMVVLFVFRYFLDNQIECEMKYSSILFIIFKFFEIFYGRIF